MTSMYQDLLEATEKLNGAIRFSGAVKRVGVDAMAWSAFRFQLRRTEDWVNRQPMAVTEAALKGDAVTSVQVNGVVFEKEIGGDIKAAESVISAAHDAWERESRRWRIQSPSYRDGPWYVIEMQDIDLTMVSPADDPNLHKVAFTKHEARTEELAKFIKRDYIIGAIIKAIRRAA